MSWSAVGSPVVGGSSSPSFGLSVSPTAVGNIVVVAASTEHGASGPGISGGGVTTWYDAGVVAGLYDPFWPNLGAQNRSTLKWGIVTTAGASTLTATESTGDGLGVIYQEFTYAGATGYSQDTTAGSFGIDGNGVSGPSSGNFAAVTPGGSGLELYIGVGFWFFAPTVSNPGFTSVLTPVVGFTGEVGLVYALDVDTSGGPYSPAWSMTSGGPSCDFICCIEATVPSPPDNLSSSFYFDVAA